MQIQGKPVEDLENGWMSWQPAVSLLFECVKRNQSAAYALFDLSPMCQSGVIVGTTKLTQDTTILCMYHNQT